MIHNKNMTTKRNSINIFLRLIISFFIVVLLFNINNKTTHAQLELGLRDTDISTKITPEFPEGGELVTITLSSFSIDVDSLTMVWKKDGVLLKSGVGIKSISTESPNIGDSTTITIDVSTGQQSVRKTIIISPSEVDLLWESTDSYVTPFYKGKALPSKESLVRVVAVPNTKIPASDLVYTWRKNFTSAQGFSGYGKQSIETSLAYLDPTQKIEVSINNVSKTYSAYSSISIVPQTPMVIYYEVNPKLGLLTNISLSGVINTPDTNFELFAAPFFFSAKSVDSNELTYNWTVGNQNIDKGSVKNRVTLQFNKNESGSTQVNTEIRNVVKFLQKAKSSITITKK